MQILQNVGCKIKNYLNFEKVLDYIFNNLPGIIKIKYIIYFGYLLPSIDLNTFIIINYIGQKSEVIEHYLSKNNYIKEKTYNYLCDFVEYLSNNKKPFSRVKHCLDNYNLYKKILSNIPTQNIIKQSDNLYKSKLELQITEENYNKLLLIKLDIYWLYDVIIKKNILMIF